MLPRTSRTPGRARLRGLAATSLVAVLATSALAGCGGDSPASDPSARSSATAATLPSGDPTAGVRVDGDGYSLVVPSGWADSTETVRKRFSKVDRAAGDTSVTGGFADNVNVIVSDKRRIQTQRKAEATLRRELGLVARQVRIGEPADLDGETAYHATARLKLGRISVRTSQYFARHGKAWYLLTFSYGPQTDAATEAEEVQQMLDSWSWKD
jgi:hypothetical protein